MDAAHQVHRVHLHTHRYDSYWGVQFLEADLRTSVGPWLLYDTVQEVEAILRWGNITEGNFAEHQAAIRQWGVAGGWLNLTPAQYRGLVARRRGFPWNGYELIKMKKEGRYPPQRLTPAQEAAFLRNRRPRHA